MNKYVTRCVLVVLATLVNGSQAASAHAEDLRCEVIFAGPSAAVAAEAEAAESNATVLRFTFGGFLQCTAPAATAFKSFADPGAGDRQVVVTLQSSHGSISMAEQRLKDCHRQALLAMSNPARYLFSLAVTNVQIAATQTQSVITASVDSATSVGCSLGVNSTGLK